jgi:hypothetical protein
MAAATRRLQCPQLRGVSETPALARAAGRGCGLEGRRLKAPKGGYRSAYVADILRRRETLGQAEAH